MFGSISGTVYDKQSNKIIQNAIIISQGKEYKVNRNGNFTVPNDKSIGVRAIGYERKFYTSSGKIFLSPLIPKALYLSSFGATNLQIMKNAKELMKNTEINSLVIDVKMDRGQVAFVSSNPIAKNIGAQELILFKNLPNFIRELKKEGIYTIARIVTFKDTPLATAYPQWSIKTTKGEFFKDKEGLRWIDPSIKESWSYVLSIAKESAKCGFDEIQFDYVRFPDREGIEFSVKNTSTERIKAISDFLETARKELTPYNVFISADIFGYVSWDDGDLEIGQKIENISKHVDYLSPMLYPSGFHMGIPGHRNPVVSNYEIIKQSLDRSLQKSKGSPLAYRPWLQAFRDYAFDKRIYGEKEIRAQIKASEDFGSAGWILWNPRNVYTSAGLTKE